MARLSKTPGVELYRFESEDGQGQTAFYSKGHVLHKERKRDGKWGPWVRNGKWKIGTMLDIKKMFLEAGWKVIREMGKEI